MSECSGAHPKTNKKKLIKKFKKIKKSSHYLRNGRQATVSFVDILDLPIAASKDGNTFEHRNSVVVMRGAGAPDDDDQSKVRRMRMR